MSWGRYSKLKGQHALLSPSNYHWINYDKEKLLKVLYNQKMKERGTKLHEFASEAINLKRYQAGNDNVSQFVNDCIDMKMHSEEVVYATEYAFGTADAINEVNDVIYIFDLKTGEHKAKFTQLYLYAAFYCIMNDINPISKKYVFRIYQYEEYEQLEGDPLEVKRLMELTIEDSDVVKAIEEENGV